MNDNQRDRIKEILIDLVRLKEKAECVQNELHENKRMMVGTEQEYKLAVEIDRLFDAEFTFDELECQLLTILQEEDEE